MKKLFLLFAIVVGFTMVGCKGDPNEKPNGGGSDNTPKSLLQVDKSTIYLGETVNFTVSFEDQDVTTESVVYNIDGGALEGYSFTAETTGVYKFYALYKGQYKSDILSIYVKGEDSLTYPKDHNPGNIAFHHRAVVIDHTGVNCSYCPGMIDRLLMLDESEWGDFYNEVTCHAGGMAHDDPAFSAAADMLNQFHSYYINGYPQVCVNLHTARVDNTVNFVKDMGGVLQNYIKKEGADVGIAMSVDKLDNSIICSAQIKSAKYQEYRVNAWLLESDIYSPNQAGATKEHHYYYHHALRNTSESVSEADFAGLNIGTIEAGMTYDYDCEIARESGWVAENMEVLIVVSAKNFDGVWEVVNTANCPVGKSLPYRYVGEPESLSDAVYGSDDNFGEEQLATPVVEIKDIAETGFTAEWGAIEGASSYTLMLNGAIYTTTDTLYRFQNLSRGDYRLLVKATGEGYKDSEYSETKSVSLTGPSSIDWFTQSVDLVDDSQENIMDGINSSNAFTYSWKGDSVMAIKSYLYYADRVPSSYEEVISELPAVEAAIVEQVNSTDGYTFTYTALEADTEYALCTFVTHENGLQYLAKSVIKTNKCVISSAVEAWLGKWSAYTEDVYNFETGLRKERRDFTFIVTADEQNSGYVWVDGLSAQGEGVPAYAKVTFGENGEYILGILNGVVMEHIEGDLYAEWLSNCITYTYYDYDYDGKYDGEYDTVYESRSFMWEEFTGISLVMSDSGISCEFHEDWLYEDMSYKVNFMDVFIFNIDSGKVDFFTETDGTPINEFRAGAYLGITKLE